MFKYVYWMEPIDFWDKAELADTVIAKAVIDQMPEEPRDYVVYKLVFPDPPNLNEIYLCKADNNGTVYVFSNFDIEYFSKYLTRQ